MAFHISHIIMIVLTKLEPEYALKNQMIGVRIDLENTGNTEKRAEILLFVSEKSQHITNNLFDKRDSLNTVKTEVIDRNKSVSLYIPLKNGILVDRGVISYTVELKEL
jgi:hypothetical protein